jgi:hypothetical protein
MSNEVTDLLSDLRNGTIDVDEVARRFRERSWPRRDNPRRTTYLELAKQAQEDPEPYIPGSYDDVAAAFHRGDLSIDQYDLLAHAIAESMLAEDRQSSKSDEQG